MLLNDFLRRTRELARPHCKIATLSAEIGPNAVYLSKLERGEILHPPAEVIGRIIAAYALPASTAAALRIIHSGDWNDLNWVRSDDGRTAAETVLKYLRTDHPTTFMFLKSFPPFFKTELVNNLLHEDDAGVFFRSTATQSGLDAETDKNFLDSFSRELNAPRPKFFMSSCAPPTEESCVLCLKDYLVATWDTHIYLSAKQEDIERFGEQFRATRKNIVPHNDACAMLKEVADFNASLRVERGQRPAN